MNSNFRYFAVWVIIAVLLVGLFKLFQQPAQSRMGTEISYSEFIAAVESRSIEEVLIQGSRLSGKYRSSGNSFTTFTPGDPSLVEKLQSAGVKIRARPTEEEVPSIFSVLISWLPMLLVIAVWIYLMRQMQSGSGRAMGFGKSKAKLLTERHGRVTFDDVAGVDEAKGDLQEVVEFLRDPQKFQRLGGRIPRGCLLVGPPGTGKTLIARAVAGEANVPFFTISGSDFVEMFVGVGASRVRDMFEQAKKNAPCIIFIDEIDAVGRHRGAGLGGGNDEREQTLNQLLVEMDGFEANEGIIIIAATNRPDVLDPALLRPGRFDRQITVPNPDVGGREKILRVHMRKVPLAPDVDAKVLARGTPGFSGADLANLVNEAALLAARRNKRLVTQQEFEDAKDKVMMGAERRSMVMTDDEKKMTAYHEAGHAIVSVHEDASDPIHKATIIPRGRALGMVMRLPERDSYSYHRDKMHANLSVSMGGRVAEEIIFGHNKVSSGASSDIQYATDLARNMVTRWGMSEKLGPLQYEASQDGYLGMGQTMRTMSSDETNKLIDAEIKSLVEGAHARATDILKTNEEQLHLLAQALLEYETLTGDEITALLETGRIDRPDAPRGPVIATPVRGTAIPRAGKRFGGPAKGPAGDEAPQGA
ncbi:MAG: ATP-dependent zinc metalloprotease FtsH [Hyphomicrobiaceae bacterium]